MVVSISFQSAISSFEGLAAHHLNTFAISVATAFAETEAEARFGLPVISASRFFTWLSGLNLVFHNVVRLSANVLICHSVVFTDILFVLKSHDVRFFINSILVFDVFVSKSGFICIALAMICLLVFPEVAHIHGISWIDMS